MVLWWMPLALASEAPVRAWEVGAGARNSLYEEQLVEGAHVIARRRQGPWSLALRGYARLIEPQPSALDETLVLVADNINSSYTQPVTLDQQALALVAGWHPWESGGLGGAPVLYLGAEARRQAHYWLYSNGSGTLSFDGPESSVYVGPVIGAGFEVEAGPIVSRLVLSDRMLVAPEQTYDRHVIIEEWTLHHAPTVSLDVLVRLGGQR